MSRIMKRLSRIFATVAVGNLLFVAYKQSQFGAAPLNDDFALSLDLKAEENHSEKSSNNAYVIQADAMIQAAAEELEKHRVPFYMYADENITQSLSYFRIQQNKWKRFRSEVDNDEQMLAALQKSELKTNNPDDAELFIAPVPLGRIFSSRNPESYIHAAMKALVNHEVFRKHEGNKHVLINTPFLLFRQDYVKYSFSMKPYYPFLHNVTAILCWDPSATYNDIHHSGGQWNEFLESMTTLSPMTRRSASVGFGHGNDYLELTMATKAKFDKSSNFIFYHSRRDASVCNSTIYRQAPITNITDDKFPKSSIGFGLEKEQWVLELMNSKFCLVVRGDSPGSHALWRSIRIGCIPVIASDNLPIWGPIFKSTINMSDYGVIVSEKAFVNNPEKTLLKLNDMSEAEIEVKMKHLAFAQRVIFTDHPDSLFVSAFLKESMMASEVKTSEVNI